MSVQERDRLFVIAAVHARRLTPHQAAEQLGISARPVRHSLQRFRAQGAAGPAHRSRGRPSHRRVPPEIAQQAREALREDYADFGPTFAAQQLQERHGIKRSQETVRRLPAEEDLRRPQPRRLKHRTRRPPMGGAWRVSAPAFSDAEPTARPQKFNLTLPAQGLWLKGVKRGTTTRRGGSKT